MIGLLRVITGTIDEKRKNRAGLPRDRLYNS